LGGSWKIARFPHQFRKTEVLTRGSDTAGVTDAPVAFEKKESRKHGAVDTRVNPRTKKDKEVVRRCGKRKKSTKNSKRTIPRREWSAEAE